MHDPEGIRIVQGQIERRDQLATTQIVAHQWFRRDRNALGVAWVIPPEKECLRQLDNEWKAALRDRAIRGGYRL
jgi:hypothetical protein